MRIKLQYEINEFNDSEIIHNEIISEMQDPVFLNMQFAVEREHYERLIEVCREFKLSGIHEALNDLLQNPNPNTIIDQYGP